MLDSVIKTSVILVGFMLSNSVLALTQSTTGPTVNHTASEMKATPIEPSIPVESWPHFQPGFNPFLQLDSAFAQPFFSNPLYFNRLMMQEKPKQYLISFDMPGVDPHKIKVSISQGILFVKAKSTNEDLKRDDHNQYVFSYHVALPDNANPKKVNAVLHRGVLKITIEKNNQLAAMAEIPVKEIA